MQWGFGTNLNSPPNERILFNDWWSRFPFFRQHLRNVKSKGISCVIYTPRKQHMGGVERAPLAYRNTCRHTNISSFFLSSSVNRFLLEFPNRVYHDGLVTKFSLYFEKPKCPPSTGPKNTFQGPSTLFMILGSPKELARAFKIFIKTQITK